MLKDHVLGEVFKRSKFICCSPNKLGSVFLLGEAPPCYVGSQMKETAMFLWPEGHCRVLPSQPERGSD